MKKFYVLKDGGGGIILIIKDENDKPIFVHSDYEFHPYPDLLIDLEHLLSGDNVSSWDGNDLTAEHNRDKDVEAMVELAIAQYPLVADNDGVYLDPCPKGNRGTAEEAFGVTEEYAPQTVSEAIEKYRANAPKEY